MSGVEVHPGTRGGSTSFILPGQPSQPSSLSFEQVLELTSSVWEANRATFGHNLPIEGQKQKLQSLAIGEG